ncbi:MAG: radical SAM protein [Sporomusaceae bacterium]|nr:radical SAM protein [Sporomusaceae bacterium]
MTVMTDAALWPAEYLGDGRPPRSLSMPWQMNVALTTRCPLSCPQCYVKAAAARDIDWDVLTAFVAEAAALKVHELNLSGGEPLSYPRLAEVVRLATAAGIGTAVATSGVGLTAELAKELAASGLGSLWLSLNGSREDIHALSRTCFRETVAAADLLRSLGQPFYINWVARRDNADDFPALAAKARELGARGIVVLVLKPDSRHNAEAVLTGEAFFRLAAFLRDYDDPAMPIEVESCYPALRLAVYGEWTTGIETGCGAGRDAVAVDVDGRLSPCPHLDFPETGLTIAEYWQNSPVLAALRATEETIGAPCRRCGHLPYCRPCRAKAAKVYGDPATGDRQCPVALRELTGRLFG